MMFISKEKLGYIDEERERHRQQIRVLERKVESLERVAARLLIASGAKAQQCQPLTDTDFIRIESYKER